MNRDSRVEPTGFMQEVSRKHHVQGTVMDGPTVPGRHDWMIVAGFRVANPARERHLMDNETLITVEGPGCVHCGVVWSPTVGSKCSGKFPVEDPS